MVHALLDKERKNSFHYIPESFFRLAHALHLHMYYLYRP